jgi:hypothetical protein
MGVALSTIVCLSATDGSLGTTVTESTGGFTVTAAVALTSSLVAVIVATEEVTTETLGVTNPVELTLAIVASDEVQVTGNPVSALPLVSASSAVSRTRAGPCHGRDGTIR